MELAGALPTAASAMVSVLRASCSACFVMMTMLMRRLIGFCGSARSKSTEEANPTTRAIFSSGRPEDTRARRAALARSADSSQFE